MKSIEEQLQETMQQFTPSKPKLFPYYENLAMKNMYQPFFDLINIQSKWTDFYSKLVTESNDYVLGRLNNIFLNKKNGKKDNESESISQ